MTREEEIKEQAEKKALEPSRLMHPYAKQYKVMSAYEIGFIEGAVWADAHPHWISVEDELPEVCVAVLTTTPHGTQRVGFYEDGWWLANTTDLVRMGSITHWMPLPQPPHHFADVSQKVKEGGEL